MAITRMERRCRRCGSWAATEVGSEPICNDNGMVGAHSYEAVPVRIEAVWKEEDIDDNGLPVGSFKVYDYDRIEAWMRENGYDPDSEDFRFGVPFGADGISEAQTFVSEAMALQVASRRGMFLTVG